MITIKTNHGDIGVELFDEKAPLSCENFRQYVSDGHFNGTIFHRVIPNFMIQCGGMDENMNSKPTRDPIKNEADNGEKNRAAHWQWRVPAMSIAQPHNSSST